MRRGKEEKATRRKQAEERKVERDKRTPKQQLKRLKHRPGDSKREKIRLMGIKE